MKYDSFNGIYKWARKDTYICQICSEEVRSYRRMRHIGQHIRDGQHKKLMMIRYNSQKQKGE